MYIIKFYMLRYSFIFDIFHVFCKPWTLPSILNTGSYSQFENFRSLPRPWWRHIRKNDHGTLKNSDLWPINISSGTWKNSRLRSGTWKYFELFLLYRPGDLRKIRAPHFLKAPKRGASRYMYSGTWKNSYLLLYKKVIFRRPVSVMEWDFINRFYPSIRSTMETGEPKINFSYVSLSITHMVVTNLLFRERRCVTTDSLFTGRHSAP